MINSFCFSSRSEHLIRSNSDSITHLRVPAAEAVRVAAALATNTKVVSLELDFSCHDATDCYAALVPILESTESLQRVQLYGAQQDDDTTTTTGEPKASSWQVLLRAVQRNPFLRLLEIVGCCLVPEDFAWLPARCALRGVRVAQEHNNTPVDWNRYLTTSNKHITSLRLTSHLGLDLLVRILQHLPPQVEHVAVYHHHGSSLVLLQTLAALTVPQIQVEYMEFPTITSLRTLLDGHGERKKRFTFKSCLFQADPWPLLKDVSVAYEGICPPLTQGSPMMVRHLDVSKVVMERPKRLEQILSHITDGVLESLVLGDINVWQCELLSEKLPQSENIRCLSFCLRGCSNPRLVKRLRQGLRSNSSVVDCRIGGNVLSAADTAAIHWYTAQRNKKLPRLVCPECPDDHGLLPYLYRFSLDSHRAPTDVSLGLLLESLPCYRV